VAVAQGDGTTLPAEPSEALTSQEAQKPTAAELKQAGNEAYLRQEVGLAVDLWNRALAQYVAEIRPGASRHVAFSEESRLLESSLYLNLAQGHLKLGEPHRALRACEVVIKEEPSNIKALYRGSEALLALKDFSNATSWLAKLQEVDPENGDAKRLQSRLRSEQRHELEREKAAAKRMCSATAGFSEGRPAPKAQPDMPVSLERLQPENMAASLNIAEEAARAARGRQQDAADKNLPVPNVNDLDSFRAKVMGKTKKYGAFIDRSQKARSSAERSLKLAWLRGGGDGSGLDEFEAPLRSELQAIEHEAIVANEADPNGDQVEESHGSERPGASACMEMMD